MSVILFLVICLYVSLHCGTLGRPQVAADVTWMHLFAAAVAALERDWFTVAMALACAGLWAWIWVHAVGRHGSGKIPGHSRGYR